MKRRVLEFVLIFWVLPPLVALAPTRVLPPIPVLWVGAIAALLFLRRQVEFDRRLLWGVAGVRPGLRGVLLRFTFFGPAMIALAWLLEPEWFLSFPRDRPLSWAMVMLLYPILSVVPQGILYRSFLCHRYRPLFGDGRLMIGVAAASFGFAHIVMHRWEPVFMTTIGGLVLTRTLLVRRSGLLADLEHALYGNLAFTLGLGVWIFTGAARQGL